MQESLPPEALDLGPDKALISTVLSILRLAVWLIPKIYRLTDIFNNPEHVIFTLDVRDISPEFREHMKKMRREQVGAILHLAKVIERTTKQTQLEAPAIDAAARQRIIDESLGHIFPSDDKGQNVQ